MTSRSALHPGAEFETRGRVLILRAIFGFSGASFVAAFIPAALTIAGRAVSIYWTLGLIAAALAVAFIGMMYAIFALSPPRPLQDAGARGEWH